MCKVQLSELADMTSEERDSVYADIMRTSARPEQRTALRPSFQLVQYERVFHAFELLQAEGASIAAMESGEKSRIPAHR